MSQFIEVTLATSKKRKAIRKTLIQSFVESDIDGKVDCLKVEFIGNEGVTEWVKIDESFDLFLLQIDLG